jgi:Polyphosphate kinase 2 (PPK2)
MYFQRYIPPFPAAGEVIIFDRSRYNRAGVEYVMGFCTEEEHRQFLILCPEVEQYIVDGGIVLIEFWLEVGKEEQERRFLARIHDPLRQWKLSPMDLESYARWYQYSKARDIMLKPRTPSLRPGISCAGATGAGPWLNYFIRLANSHQSVTGISRSGWSAAIPNQPQASTANAELLSADPVKGVAISSATTKLLTARIRSPADTDRFDHPLRAGGKMRVGQGTTA